MDITNITESFKERDQVAEGGGPQYAPLPVYRYEDLAECSTDYVLYTPALMYLYGGLSELQLRDFLSEHGKSCTFFYYMSKTPMFRGLSLGQDHGWNSTLLAVKRVHWDAWRNFMLSLCLTNFKKEILIKVGEQGLRIPDPELRISDKPLIEVTSFSPNSNTFCVAMDQGDCLIRMPYVRTHEPQEEAVVFAKALFSGGNPDQALAEFERQKNEDKS